MVSPSAFAVLRLITGSRLEREPISSSGMSASVRIPDLKLEIEVSYADMLARAETASYHRCNAR
jgi:hypothetical protein